MTKSILTAALFAVIALALAPAAQAAPYAPTYPLTFTEDGTVITLRYFDANLGSAVLIDTNGDGKADKSIVNWPTQAGGIYASYNDVNQSTTSCQQVRQGTNNLPARLTRGRFGGDAVELDVPLGSLPVGSVVKAVPYVSTYLCTLPGYSGIQALMPNGASQFGLDGPLDAPANLHAVAGNGKVTLTWSPVTGASSYVIYRDGVRVQTTTNVSADVTGLANGTNYSFAVVAAKAPIESKRSLTVEATPTAPGPPQLNAPTNLQAVAGNAHVTLTWDAVRARTPTRSSATACSSRARAPTPRSCTRPTAPRTSSRSSRSTLRAVPRARTRPSRRRPSRR